MRAVDHAWAAPVTEECYLLVQKSAIRSDCGGCTDICRWPCKYKTDAYPGTAEHVLEFREGGGGCCFEMEIVAGPAVGVRNRGVTGASERYTDDTAETVVQAVAC
jgi:hypothetical protein